MSSSTGRCSRYRIDIVVINVFYILTKQLSNGISGPLNVVRRASNGGTFDRDRGGRSLFGEQNQLLLDNLELGDRPVEQDAIIGAAGG